jgi:hypothetical protein
MIRAQIDDKLISFPSVNIALRIYLSIFGPSADEERSFSKMKLIKNYLRSTMGQQRLSSLSLLSIENYVTRQLPFDEIISEFAHKNVAKLTFKH